MKPRKVLRYKSPRTAYTASHANVVKDIWDIDRPLATKITKHVWNTKMKEITKSKLAEPSWDEKSKYNGTRQKYYTKMKTGLSENSKRWSSSKHENW
jgi:hypothetical protein